MKTLSRRLAFVLLCWSRTIEATCLTKRSLRIALAISVSLASCAKPPTTIVTVKVDESFSGYFRLTACIAGAPKPVLLSDEAEGNTSACPSGDVKVAVLKPSKTFFIAPENVHVYRNLDGTPQAISGQIP